MQRGIRVKRTCTCGDLSWEERVLIARSPAYAQKQQSALEKRLDKAKSALLALTPPIGPGKKLMKNESDLIKAAEAIILRYDVNNLLTYTYEQEKKLIEKFVGRGRSGEKREKKVIEHVRYQITGVQRCEQAIAERTSALGHRFQLIGKEVAKEGKRRDNPCKNEKQIARKG